MALGIAFPNANFNSFNVAEVDPGAARHLVSGSFAYDRLLDVNPSGSCGLELDFGNLTLTLGASQVASDVKAVNLAFEDLETLASQSGAPTVVNNFRLWLPSASGTLLDPPGISLQVVTSGSWVQNFAFPSGGGQELPNSVPVVQNLFRIDGHHSISGFKASEVTQYMYFRLFVDPDYPTGTFGFGCGSGILRPVVTYDFY